MEVGNLFLGKVKRVGLTTLMLGVMSLSLVACGGNEAAPVSPQATATATTAAVSSSQDNVAVSDAAGVAQEVKVDLKEWGIEMDSAEVKAGKVKFLVSNTGEFSHNMVVSDGQGTIGQTIAFTPDQGTQTLEVDLKPGTYNLICSIPGHAEHGMVTEITVR